MLFNSWVFFGFLAVVLAGYYALRARRWQNMFLLLASYAFYAAWDWRFLSLIWLSTLVDYTVGRAMGGTTSSGRRRVLLAVSIVANLGVLGFFKYCNFFVDSGYAFLQMLGLSPSPLVLQIALPVGISFYTFQTLSYTIDVYRGELAPTRSLRDFALYVAFFPQLVAGPIERASRFLPQILNPRRTTREQWSSGAWLIVFGLFKKVFVADNLAPLVDEVYGGTDVAAWQVVLATYAFAFQIYCDFSGYTDIARGVAKLLGFELMLNFRLPYLSTTPSEFWRRWHISLSTWLRDYLYIPLGGNRGGRLATGRNLMLTMLLGGLWHGAAWNFVIWGGFHGLLLGGQRALLGREVREVGSTWLRRIAAVVLMFHLTCLGWLLFRATSLEHVGTLLTSLAGDWTLYRDDVHLLSQLLLFVMPLLLIETWLHSTDQPWRRPGWSWGLGPAAVTTMLLAMLMLAPPGNQAFLYFQF